MDCAAEGQPLVTNAHLLSFANRRYRGSLSRIRREARHHDVEHGRPLRRTLVAGEATDVEPVERDGRDERGGLLAELAVEAALDDAEERLVRPMVRVEGPDGP